MQFDLVVVAERDRDATLRVFQEDSRRLSLATTSTVPASASSIAARNPATPAPMTRKSGFIRNCQHSSVGQDDILRGGVYRRCSPSTTYRG